MKDHRALKSVYYQTQGKDKPIVTFSHKRQLSTLQSGPKPAQGESHLEFNSAPQAVVYFTHLARYFELPMSTRGSTSSQNKKVERQTPSDVGSRKITRSKVMESRKVNNTGQFLSFDANLDEFEPNAGARVKVIVEGQCSHESSRGPVKKLKANRAEPFMHNLVDVLPVFASVHNSTAGHSRTSPRAITRTRIPHLSKRTSPVCRGAVRAETTFLFDL
jgi:hypothetical protein